MRKPLTILFLVASLGATTQANADRYDCAIPVAKWQPREAVERVAKEHGLTVFRIKIDDGCYKIKGTDASGRHVKIKLNPETLEIINREHDD